MVENAICLEKSANSLHEEDYLPISAVQHYIFCPRQCALIHIEQAWEENRLTVEGKHMHEKVHEARYESRGDVRYAYGLYIRSKRLGISGKADLVEFHREADKRWKPYPVEFKHGHTKMDDFDRLQLCAQAVCLEEMLVTVIPEGAIFYGQPRKREIVIFSPELRNCLEEAVIGLRSLITCGQTPPAEFASKCRSCSLLEYCLPILPKKENSVMRYLNREMDQL
jgi:CRISPR-associated exonuclease Cas4